MMTNLWIMWLIMYGVTLGIAIGLHESDDGVTIHSVIAFLVVALITFFIWPLVLGLMLTRVFK